MKLADFDYTLPKELIAQYPLKARDAARLLVLERESGKITHCIFRDIVDYFQAGDLLVLNNTKVLPCRLFGKRPTGGKVELLLLNRKQGGVFNALVKPGKLHLNEKISFNGGAISACLSAKNEVTFNTEDLGRIYKLGVMPLPPYIKRASEAQDERDYQTIYAEVEGAVASPTAGLHFTEGLLEKLQARKVNLCPVTLHVGWGTFRQVLAEDIREHQMEPEYFQISHQAVTAIRKAREDKKRIFCVGTTSLRTLESYALGKQAGTTDLFIYPGYQFRMSDALITNFHLPRTTLFMLVCAFAGETLAKKAYAEAIKERYRFYSYGDGMLIL